MLTAYPEILSAVARLNPGDVVIVRCAGYKDRRLTVTGRVNATVLLTSGKVRPGHFAGGALRDYGRGSGVQYQPTMQQPVRKVEGLEVVEAAPVRVLH